MNNAFSFFRFWFLLKKYLSENRKSIGLYTIGLFLFLFVLFGLIVLSSLHSNFPADLQTGLFAIGLLFGGSIFSSSFYGFFSNKPKAIRFINLPATTGEKFLLGFIITQVLFFVVFIVFFSTIDQLMCGLYNNNVAPPAWVLPYDRQLNFHATPLDFFGERNNQIYIMLFFILSAFMHLGSLSFEKNAFILTSLFIILAFTIIVFYNNRLMIGLIPETIVPRGKFFNDSFRIDNGKTIKGVVSLPEKWDQLLSILIPASIFICCWSATYFKLKEKQV